ncbi:MAG TPA: tRNA epoxyqueuosine(34) reductase QueG [Terriglobales bacterium]|jgi:epoxyqueuosine reductase
MDQINMGACNPQQLHEFAVAEALRQGFDWAGVATAAPPPRLAGVARWLEEGRGGEMRYLERRDEEGHYLREAVTRVWPWARSVLCAAVIYNSHPPEPQQEDPRRGWISRYAWGDDYHDVLRARLKAWMERLREYAGQPAEFHLTVDTAPLVERAAAAAAGLGWQGKNTCLIHPQRGSWFFLGTVVTSLEIAADTPQTDRCGSCTRCIDACPTQALTPYEMDARRCLAYLNIELRGSIPEEFRAPMGDNVLGCDICQEVCPWNRRAPANTTTDAAEFQPRLGLFAPLLAELAGMDEAAYRERFRHSAVKRAKFAGLQRNVAIAMGNSGEAEFRPQLEAWAAGDDPVVAEHAQWALRQLPPEDNRCG